MTTPNLPLPDGESTKHAIDTALRLGAVALMVYWSFRIFQPFVMPVLWAGIIAVAVYPLFLRFEKLLGGKRKLALTLFTLLALAILIVPTVMLANSTASAVQTLSVKIEEETLQVPPPPAAVAEWPLVGEKLHNVWNSASNNLAGTVKKYAPQIKQTGKWLLGAAAGAGAGVLQFVIAILIAAAFMANAEPIQRFFQLLTVRLAGEQGRDFAELASATTRSVAQGVLGVAFIQALLSGIGMLVVGVPGAGLWALLVLLLAVIQLPPLLILGPVAAYVFSVADTLPAVLFLIWALLVSASDAVLKPMFLGRGLDIPMLVILIGALGGMMMSGIIGLFVGAIIMALSYRLFMVWLTEDFGGGESEADAEKT
jgi:predicted PurR-regulated permease PerM